MTKKPEKSTDNSHVSMLEHVFSIVEHTNDFKQIMKTLFEEVANLYDFDSIVLKEITSPNTIKCSYEWCNDGICELENVEKRFIENIQTEWVNEFSNENKVWIYYQDDHLVDEAYPFLSRHEFCRSVIQFPLFKGDKLIGLLDMYDGRHKYRQWKPERIEDIYHFVRILVSYLLPLRELDMNEKKIIEISEYDSITHLPKYEVFYNEVNNFKSRVDDCKIQIFSLDISNFKFINEKYGYLIGNRLLYEVAEQIYSSSDKIISCCRPLSDNFLIAIKAPEKDNFAYIKEVLNDAVHKYIDHMREFYYDTNIILNVGISTLKKNDFNIKNAVANANIARKFAKETKAVSNCRIMMYNVYMSLEVRKQADFIASMSKGIEDNEFFIQLQPKCMTDSFTIFGAEALVRWRKEIGDIIYPQDFIPIFEKNGCIVKLDYFVYDKVFAYISDRIRKKLPIVPISVNVSYVHFRSLAFIDYIKSLLEKYKIPTEFVEFELTEIIYISDNPYVETIINELKTLGFKIFIDDFGTGYSSLNTLTKYSIDGIKLDRSFMDHKLEQKDKVIISCMVNMANKLGLEVLCEGVETEEQRMFLIENECPYMQGFCFSHPVSIDQFDYLLDNQ